MRLHPLPARRLAGVAALAAASLASGPARPRTEGYAPANAELLLDTLRLKARKPTARSRHSALVMGAVIPGYLSARGLPPVRGQFTLTGRGLVFHSPEGSVATFPLVGPVRESRGRRWRPSTVSLAYTAEDEGHPVYVFRIDAGVFETDTPGPLLDVASHPEWLDSLSSTEWMAEQPLVKATDSAAVWSTAREIGASSYADSLYLLFGRPRAAIGLVGPRGRTAGRLGEFIASRDSLALDPGHMTGTAQLRHTMAHELGHRWQAHAPRQLATLWSDVAPIRDPKRYGYNDVFEHQAEAIAFAIHFLQTTSGMTGDGSEAITLLDHYELLVPGTRIMVRYLSLQPLYRNHPLRDLLTGGPAS